MEKDHRFIARDLLLLIVTGLVLWLWTCGQWDLWGEDESRYVQVARELLNRGNWFFLTVHGVPYDQKPPLPFWIFSGILSLSGGVVSAWALRLPGMVAGLACVLATYWIGRVRFGRRAGLIAGLMLMAMPLFAKQAITARLDVMFAAWTTAALAVWLGGDILRRMEWGRAAVFWLLLIGAFFTKGPLCFVIVLGPVALEAWSRRSAAVWRAIRPVWGLAVTIALIAAWITVQRLSAGEAFVQKQVVGGSIGRLFNSAHSAPVWYYLTHLFLGGLLPWNIFLFMGLWVIWKLRRNWKKGVTKTEDANEWADLRPVVLWLLLPAIVLHLSLGKRQFYFLPLLPPMALIAGWYCDRWLRGALPSWVGRVAAGLGGGLALGLAAAGVAVAVRPAFFQAHDLSFEVYQIIPIACVAFFVGAVAVRLWRCPDNARLLALLFTVMLGMELTMFASVYPAMNGKKSCREFSRAVAELVGTGRPEAGAIGKAEKSMYHVYGGYRVIPIDGGDKAYRVTDKTPDVIVVCKPEMKKVPESILLAYAPVDRLDAAGDAMVLLRRIGAVAEAGTPRGK